VRRDQSMERLQRDGTGPYLVGQRRQAELDAFMCAVRLKMNGTTGRK